ncbi:glycosyl hydrolase [Sorangium cellulosum]|uniref:Glycosyl hydrolase n=1 Tax=Sorangium cellulosum TaxID=56 RepID=A0A2L0EL16_SORCE|nr:glycoside hydrolase family 88 protein [Sorangium cellulosum]AUX39996.1 glycosyl hydrolase [Sorangium cellulosum]
MSIAATPRARRRHAPRLRALLVAAAAAGAAAGCSGDPDPGSTCTPTSPSAEDTFARERAPGSEDIALARAVADRWIAEHPADSLAWDWGEGTVMLALVDLYRVTQHAPYRDYTRRYLDRHIERGYEIATSDRCPPAVAALALHEQTCAAPYRQVVDDVLRYLYEQARRTEQGGISHLGVSPLFEPTLWVDSLFMFGNVLIRSGERADDARALDEFSNQFQIFASLLQEEPGLFRHAYNWGTPQDPGVYWARGNAWVTAAGYDYLRVRAARGERDDAVAGSLERQVAAILDTQDQDTGLWWTIMNHPDEIYLETSATALFAVGLARGLRHGFLDASVRPAVDRAMAGVRSRIEEDEAGRPVVTGTSGPTSVGRLEHYAAVELRDDLSYGVGAVLLALVETSGL